MKTSEAEPLSIEELKTFKSLFQRWYLCNYPQDYDGSAEQSDSLQTYLIVKKHAARNQPQVKSKPKDQSFVENEIL